MSAGYLFRLFLLSVALLGCAKDPIADSPVVRLAQDWSGSSELPLCQRSGPDGEALVGAGTRYCVWTTARTNPGVALTAIVREQGALVTWQRAMRDASDAERLTDSLRTELVALGLRERDCGELTSLSGVSQGVRWEGAELVVDLTRVSPHRGSPRIQIIASNLPNEMPPVLCGASSAQ